MALLIVLVAPCETLSRLPRVQSLLLPPVISDSPETGMRLYDLDRYVRQAGDLDCVIVGSSIPNLGIEPETLSEAYQQETAAPLNCFNFAILGLSDRGTAALAGILLKRYHPRLIVYGVSVHDFGNGLNFDMDNPWARYETGSPDPQGWLESTFLSYRYYLTYSLSLTSSNAAPLLRHQERISPSGQFRSGRTVDVSQFPDRDLFSHQWKDYGRLQPRTADMSGLADLLRMNGPDVQVIIVEMPISDYGKQYLPDGEKDYQAYQERVRILASSLGVPFIGSPDANLIPADGWYDYTHLNLRGAPVFSAWLGHMLGEAVLGGTVQGPTH
jgi:hypothetical protein